MDGSGRLLGTTAQGGTGTQGTVFMIDTNGQETVLHSFTTSDDDLSEMVARFASTIRAVAANVEGELR